MGAGYWPEALVILGELWLDWTAATCKSKLDTEIHTPEQQKNGPSFIVSDLVQQLQQLCHSQINQ